MGLRSYRAFCNYPPQSF